MLGRDKRVGGAAIVQDGEGVKTMSKRNGVEVDPVNHVPTSKKKNRLDSRNTHFLRLPQKKFKSDSKC